MPSRSDHRHEMLEIEDVEQRQLTNNMNIMAGRSGL
jgi:hypothetical protein